VIGVAGLNRRVEVTTEGIGFWIGFDRGIDDGQRLGAFTVFQVLAREVNWSLPRRNLLWRSEDSTRH